MPSKPLRWLLAASLGLAAASQVSAEPGDAEKAKAMLDRVVTAVESDQKAALEAFTAGTGGFKDGTIYPFCFRVADGVVVTGQTAGKDIRTFPGVGSQLYDAGSKPGVEVTEVAYEARKPPPADATPVKKVSVVRRIGELGCGVGYYP